MRALTTITIAALITILINGCGIYSFTGASISPDIKSVSISYFENYASQAPPTLSQTFTETLKDRFMNQTSLDLVKVEGDLTFEGSITGYAIRPVAIQSNDVAASNRLTITVKVIFENKQDDKQNFKKSISKYADYDSNLDISAVENDLIEEINDQIIQVIFDLSVNNW